MTDLTALATKLTDALPGALTGHVVANGELTVAVEFGEIVRTMAYLRDEPSCAFKILVDICGVDWPKRAKRFDVV